MKIIIYLISFIVLLVLLDGCAKKPEPEPEPVIEPEPQSEINTPPSEQLRKDLKSDSTDVQESKDPTEKGGSTTTTNN